MHLQHICLFAVIHSLPHAGCRFRSFLVHSIVTFRLPAIVRAPPLAIALEMLPAQQLI